MTPATVPMISPDGKSGDIPQARAQDAIAAGFKPAMVMTSPDGQLGYIPQDRAAEALKAGFKAGQPISPNSRGMQPYQDPLQPLPVAQKAEATLESMVQGIKNGVYAIPNFLDSIHDGKPSNEIEKNGLVRGTANMVAGGFKNLNPVAPDQGQGPLNRAAETFGNIAGGVATADLMPGAEDVAAAKRGAAAVVDTAKNINPRGALAAATDALHSRTAGPQVKTMGEAARLHPNVIMGAENVFRAAAPTGMNQGFRANLYAAVGDLAEIARHTDIAENKGGIINPDMRVRATVDAITDHLKDMYEQERAPQIQRNANVPVKLPFNADAAEGLQFLSRRAGAVADRELAATVLDSRKPTVAQIDQLAKVANQELKGFESMTAAERAAATMTNRRLNGLKALDKVLGSALDEALTSQGEGGIRAYERRFAALSEVRDQLATRINATELKQEGIPGAIGRVTRPLAKLVTGGKSGIASASQAAVADVNIGKMLQQGLEKLADSGISPERPKGTGIKPPAAQSPKMLPGSTAIEMGSGKDVSGTPNGASSPTIDATTRAQRLGLLLPENTAIELGAGEVVDHPAQLQNAKSVVVRDPKTGRMKRMYLTSTAP